MRFVGAAWCVVGVACLVGERPAIGAPGPALATPASENQVAEAKQHYAAATKFYDLAEYEGALREFKEAYRAVEDPAFLFNIAQCHRKLGHTQDAITFYRTYLRRAPKADQGRDGPPSACRQPRRRPCDQHLDAFFTPRGPISTAADTSNA